MLGNNLNKEKNQNNKKTHILKKRNEKLNMYIMKGKLVELLCVESKNALIVVERLIW